MRRLNKACLRLLWLLSITAYSATSPAEQPAADVKVIESASPDETGETGLSRSQRSLAALLTRWNHLSAVFEQTASNPSIAAQMGRVQLSRPNQFRVEMDPPLSQTIVSDGETLWTWDRDLEQVIISELGSDVADVPILLFAGEPEEVVSRFNVSSFDDPGMQPGTTFYLLHPEKQGSVLERIMLRFLNGEPQSIGILTTTGQQTSLNLTDVSYEDAPEDAYAFTLPEFADVIDDRP